MKIEALGYGKDREGDYILIEVEQHIIDKDKKEGDLLRNTWKKKEHKLYIGSSIWDDKEKVIASWGNIGNQQVIFYKYK